MASMIPLVSLNLIRAETDLPQLESGNIYWPEFNEWEQKWRKSSVTLAQQHSWHWLNWLWHNIPPVDIEFNVLGNDDTPRAQGVISWHNALVNGNISRFNDLWFLTKWSLSPRVLWYLTKHRVLRIWYLACTHFHFSCYSLFHLSTNFVKTKVIFLLSMCV